ncbi:MAG: hypothetical protein AB7V42_05555 [Thermoleophilia bacterium]
MNSAVALSLRRVALLGTALAMTLAGHAIAEGGLMILPSAPILWAFLVLGAALCGGRGRFTARSLPVTATLLIVTQAALHMAMTAAPWAFGIAVHHEPAALLDLRSFALHACVALLLAVVLRSVDRALAAAVSLIRRFRAIGRTAAAPAARRRVVAATAPPPGRERGGGRRTRGPPARVRPGRAIPLPA